jgi:hypothetical protein
LRLERAKELERGAVIFLKRDHGALLQITGRATATEADPHADAFIQHPL